MARDEAGRPRRALEALGSIACMKCDIDRILFKRQDPDWQASALVCDGLLQCTNAGQISAAMIVSETGVFAWGVQASGDWV